MVKANGVVLEDGWIEGRITLGPDDNAIFKLNNFVQGKAIHAGCGILVKFGDGWIDGRYEWGFRKENPIKVYSDGDEVIYIDEGHLVRVRNI